MALKISSTNVVNDDGSFSLGSATPASPLTGQIRYTAGDGFQVYDGAAWVSMVKNEEVLPLYAWGNGANGRLGTNSTTDRSSPVTVVGGFTDWVQIASGQVNTTGVRANGTAWSWGFNNGQLGNNTNVSSSSPVSVVGGFTDWVFVASGANHMMALRANGTAWGWGSGFRGVLGNNSGSTRSSPVSVLGGFTDWTQITGGNQHTAAVRANGTAWAWGYGRYGQLGDNTTTDRSSPVSVVGGFTDWVQVAATRDSTLAIRANGTAWAWGSGYRGVLGTNNVTDRSSPVSVVGGFTDWIQIAAGFTGRTPIALRASGTAWAWGYTGTGAVGNNSTYPNRSSPVSVLGGFTDWVQVSSSQYGAAAVRTNGTAWVWGRNSFGSIGDNTTVNKSSPVSVVGGFTDWVQIVSGNNQTFALRAN